MKIRNKIRALLDNLYFDNYLGAILQRIFFRSQNLVVYRKGKIYLLVDFAGGDQCGIRPCLTSDMYSRYFGLIEKERPLKILDLGANAGGFPLSLLIAGFTFSKLVCVEMNRNTYTRLCFNLNYNILSGVTTINAAVAGRNGTTIISNNAGGTSESIYLESPVCEKNLVKVPLITLDDLVNAQFGTQENSFIDICKMDIEGAEHEVFQSQTSSAIRHARYLIIEIHSRKGFGEASLIKQICDFGFELIPDKKPREAGVHLFKNLKIKA